MTTSGQMATETPEMGIDQASEVIAERVTTYENGNFYRVGIHSINTDPNQPRKHFDKAELEALKSSIQQYGIIEPLIARLDASGSLILIAGERRFTAALELNLTEVPILISNQPPEEIALVENLLRSDLTPMEEAEALKRLQDHTGQKNKQLAVIIGKSESSVSEMLALNRLPDEVKNQVRCDKSYTRSELVKIAGKGKNADLMLSEFTALKAQKVGATPTQKVKTSAADQFKGKIESFTKYLNGFNFSSLEVAALQSAVIQLETLSTLIQQISADQTA